MQIVGDEQHGALVALPHREEQRLQQQAGLAVERAERLVHQKDIRLDGKGARHGDALAHALRQFVAVMVLELVEADAAQPFASDGVAIGDAAHFEAELDFSAAVRHGIMPSRANM